MHDLSIASASRKLAAKEFSSVELTKFFLDRISSHNTELNAYVTVCEAQALATAKQADKQLATGTQAPLCGIPVAQKDIFLHRRCKN